MLREWVIMLGLVPAKVHAYSTHAETQKQVNRAHTRKPRVFFFCVFLHTFDVLCQRNVFFFGFSLSSSTCLSHYFFFCC